MTEKRRPDNRSSGRRRLAALSLAGVAAFGTGAGIAAVKDAGDSVRADRTEVPVEVSSSTTIKRVNEVVPGETSSTTTPTTSPEQVLVDAADSAKRIVTSTTQPAVVGGGPSNVGGVEERSHVPEVSPTTSEKKASFESSHERVQADCNAFVDGIQSVIGDVENRYGPYTLDTVPDEENNQSTTIFAATSPSGQNTYELRITTGEDGLPQMASAAVLFNQVPGQPGQRLSAFECSFLGAVPAVIWSPNGQERPVDSEQAYKDAIDAGQTYVSLASGAPDLPDPTHPN